MVPITEMDKYNSKHDNFLIQQEKDINALKKRYDECLHVNKTIKEEIDVIRREKETFEELHQTYEKRINGIKNKIDNNVHNASEN